MMLDGSSGREGHVLSCSVANALFIWTIVSLMLWKKRW